MSLALKPTHATVKAYYETLHQYGQLHIDHEGAVRSAFHDLLAKSGRKAKPPLTLVPEYRIERARGSSVIVDGALVDLYHLPHGYWEAKDEKDDLAKEVQLKLDKGYPRDNIIFQAPERAILYQGGARILDENITSPESLVQIVNQFFDYKAPYIQEWEQAVSDFSERIPELANAVKKIIDEERKRNPSFVRSFDDFYALCRQAINPNLSEEAVERMLVQHLLTERIFRKIFNNPDFTRRNVVAVEIEKVITELTKRSLNRDDFLRNLERFYRAIERSAEEATSFSEKQAFLNKVYERFFQGYSPKEADTHGIVYTPQPIVNFMVRSVEEILQKEFGRSLGDKGVHILDPFVGTGNFIVRIMQEIKATDLQYKYENELHCNEVMLLPYYIASMNIEHAYFDRTDEYKAFPGICLVDTFELEEPDQGKFSFMTAENAERVKKQKESPIFVIVGNPPYNMGQLNENDNNKNRSYETVDALVSETYGRDSNARLVNKLADPYVKAIRWASNRISTGVVAFITNSSFVDQKAFDGMRQHLRSDFDEMYILDLGGNVRKNPKISGTTHNVFGIQVGVSINLLVRTHRRPSRNKSNIFYASVVEEWRKEKKYEYLDGAQSLRGIEWRTIHPDQNNNWLVWEEKKDFAAFPAIGTEGVKGDSRTDGALFQLFSLGVVTSRDASVYSFSSSAVERNVRQLISHYNSEVGRLAGGESAADASFSEELKWTDRLKEALASGQRLTFNRPSIRNALYRPFTAESLYFDHLLNQRRYLQYVIFPNARSEAENIAICVTGPASDKPFLSLAANRIVDLHLSSPGCGTQCFPFYTYTEDGTNRRENITDWALEQFRARYHDPSISKWDIFHYIYAVLHNPEYRERYAANLRRELPRIPFVSAVSSSDTLSSRAERDRPKDGLAESRDPASAGTREGAGSELSARSSSGEGRGENTPPGSRLTQADTGSFDSVNGLASESIHSAQDDRARSEAEKGADLSVFRDFVKAGERLAEIHVHYEKQAEYPLAKMEKAGEKLDWRVSKMRLSKDKTSLIYNQFLTLSGIPPESYEYRLGNRSALEWVIDQYQESTDKRSAITNDPNRSDDPQYIVRLIGQVITVSLETVRIVKALPELGIPDLPAGEFGS